MEYKIKEQEEELGAFVELWLEQNTPDSPIELRVRRSNWSGGTQNCILEIHQDGRITLPRFVSDDLGFKLDDDEKIIVEREA